MIDSNCFSNADQVKQVMSEAVPSIIQSQSAEPRKISILGATGSVGLNTLDLIGRNSEAYDVVSLTANTNVDGLAEQAIRHRANRAVIRDESKYQALKSALSGSGIDVAAGGDAIVEAAVMPADWTMAAIVGAAGLLPTFAAVRQGRSVALANKECLVSAGSVFMNEVKESKAELLPVDSEHSAVFQALNDVSYDSIEKITLTASGGPFRKWTREEINQATPADALKHPVWSMGKKISIDSATMMNKGLELIEAFHLFPVESDQLDILVHPQSIIHCLVSFVDGAVIAQLSEPDMRTPIAYSLAWPKRMQTPTTKLDLAAIGQLHFEAPDEDRFPCLRLAREVLGSGGALGAVLNAANEVAVEAFLKNSLDFSAIPQVVESVLEKADSRFNTSQIKNLEDVLSVDQESRRLTHEQLNSVQ